MVKVFYTSKTFWINFIGTLLSVVSASDVTPLLPAKAMPYVVAAVAVLNIVLRSLKNEAQGGLTFTPGAAAAQKAAEGQPPAPPETK